MTVLSVPLVSRRSPASSAALPSLDRPSALGHVLGATGFLILPLSVFAPLGTAPLLGLAALLVLLTGRRRLATSLRPLGPALVVTLLLLALGALSSLWSVVPFASLRLAGQLGATAVAAFLVLAGALVLEPADRRAVRLWLLAGVLLGAGLLAEEWRYDGALLRFLTRRPVTSPLLLTRLDRAETVMAVLVWPAVAGLVFALQGQVSAEDRAERKIGAQGRPRGRGQRLPAAVGVLLGAALVALAFLLATKLPGAAGKVAMCLGALGFLVACLAPGRVARISAALALALTLLMPLVPPLADAGIMAYPGRVEFSSEQRVAIWYFVADRVRERPLSGWGLDASRGIPGGHDQAVLPSGTALPAGSEQLPLHPHNNALQWWLELGAAGATLGGLLLALAFWSGSRRTPRTTVATGAALGIVMMVSYGAWQFWWLATIAITVAMVIAVSGPGVTAVSWRPAVRTLTGRDRY